MGTISRVFGNILSALAIFQELLALFQVFPTFQDVNFFFAIQYCSGNISSLLRIFQVLPNISSYCQRFKFLTMFPISIFCPYIKCYDNIKRLFWKISNFFVVQVYFGNISSMQCFNFLTMFQFLLVIFKFWGNFSHFSYYFKFLAHILSVLAIFQDLLAIFQVLGQFFMFFFGNFSGFHL